MCEHTQKIVVSKIDQQRLENDLVIYQSNKIKRNSYGLEVRVNPKGMIEAVAPTVEVLPGSYVISGHGTKQTFLETYALLGVKVNYHQETQTLTFIDDQADRIQFTHQHYLKTIKTKLAQFKADEMAVDYEHVTQIICALESLENDINELKDFNVLETKLNRLYQMALNGLTVSREIEARGVWHRPVEKNLVEIIELLDDLKKLNMNEIYVETFWNGYSIFPSQIAPVHPHLRGNFGDYGNDYLKTLIGEAKKRDITVHAWLENFFVGVKGHVHSSLWTQHPDWHTINYNQTDVQMGKPGGEEEGFLFFDVANDAVQDFLIEFYKELISHYDLCGIQLDYIRYPSGNEDFHLSSGYTDIAIQKFKAICPMDQDIRTFVKNPKHYALWNAFRMQCVTNFVKRVFDEVVTMKPKMLLSIAVGPDADYARVNLMQDWRTWVEKGWIDIVAPMAYVNSREAIKDIVDDMNELSAYKTYNYTGVGPTYFKLPAHYNRELIDESRTNLALGNIIFAYHNLKDNQEVKQTLISSTHRLPAIRPHDDIDLILSKGYHVTERMFDFPKGLKDSIKEIFASALRNEDLNEKQRMMYQIIHEQKLQKYEQLKSYIQYLIIIIDIKINRQKFKSKN